MHGGPNVFQFEIPTIMCQGCIKDITGKLLAQKGTVTQATINDVDGKYIATIAVSNPQVTAENIIQFIRDNTIKKHTAIVYTPEAQKKRFGM